MNRENKSVCLVASGISEENLRLQPWRYLYEICNGLASRGHRVTIISDGTTREPDHELSTGISITRLPSVRNPLWRKNALLLETLSLIGPDVIIWHVGIISFLFQSFTGPPGTPVIGVFTSPLYNSWELSHLGLSNLLRSYRFTGIHVISSLVPRWLIRNLMGKEEFLSLVVQTETTRKKFVEQVLWKKPILVIRPGVDDVWKNSSVIQKNKIRESLKFKPEDKVVVFYGSATSLRGLPTLIQSFSIACGSDPSLKLLILRRFRSGEMSEENADVDRLISNNQFRNNIHLIDGFLDPIDLVRYISAGDVVALPFELIPSDAPLSILEVGTFGMPLVTTRVACLPELASYGIHYLSDPADPGALADTLLQAVGEKYRDGLQEKVLWQRSWDDMAIEWSQLVEAV